MCCVVCWVEMIRQTRSSSSLAKSWASNTESKAFALQHYTHIHRCHLYNFICIAMVSNTKKKETTTTYHHVISGSMSFPMRLQVAWEFCNHTNASIWKQSNCVRVLYVSIFNCWSCLCIWCLFSFSRLLNSIEMQNACAIRYTVLLMCQMSLFSFIHCFWPPQWLSLIVLAAPRWAYSITIQCDARRWGEMSKIVVK